MWDWLVMSVTYRLGALGVARPGAETGSVATRCTLAGDPARVQCPISADNTAVNDSQRIGAGRGRTVKAP